MLREHDALVWSICRRLSDDPEDCYQEVWEKVLRALPSWRPDGRARLSTWIATIAHRTLIDRLRRRRTRGEEVDPEDIPVLPRPEVSLDLERALSSLPEPWRRVVVLHHVHGLDLEGIAVTEGVPTGTIKSRLHRARAALVTWMGAQK